MDDNYYIYIVTNKKHGTLYIGMTYDLIKRMYEHRNKVLKGFSSKYNLTKLVYFEHHTNKWAAADRERKLKNWHRGWKLDLIEQFNPEWKDLTITLTDSDFRQDAKLGNI